MFISRISIKQLSVTLLAFLGVCAITLSVISAVLFRDAALSAQEQTLSRIVALSARQSIEALEVNVLDMGRGAKSELSTPLSAIIRDPSDEVAKGELQTALNGQFSQRFMTAGILDVKKLRVYDLDLNPIMQSQKGISGLTLELPKFVYDKAKPREGAERLKAISGLWMTKQGAMFSVLAPLGGWQLTVISN